MNIFDSHTHINSKEFANDLPDVVWRARALDVNMMLVLAYDQESADKLMELLDEFPEVYGAIGCHPENAQLYDHDYERAMKQYLSHPKMVAVGEIGLDYHCDTPKKAQFEALNRQIELAQALHLPISIHNRDSIEDCYEILKETDAAKNGGIMHSFNGDAVWADKFLDLGFMLSYSGVCTFGNASEVREAIKHTPLDRMMVETDAPYLTPMPFRGKMNEPLMTRYTLEFIAKELKISAEDLAEKTYENTKRVLRING